MIIVQKKDILKHMETLESATKQIVVDEYKIILVNSNALLKLKL